LRDDGRRRGTNGTRERSARAVSRTPPSATRRSNRRRAARSDILAQQIDGNSGSPCVARLALIRTAIMHCYNHRIALTSVALTDFTWSIASISAVTVIRRSIATSRKKCQNSRSDRKLVGRPWGMMPR
jgi:hypothetical protein